MPPASSNRAPLRLPDAVRAPSGRSVVLIDGGSGSGKTSLAHWLAERWPGVQVVSLDDLYPGWRGLAEGSTMVATTVLRDADPGYRRWDWAACRPAEWVSLDARRDLIVEGCGALTPANRALATAGVWVTGAEGVRKERALARDGETFAPHWDEWSAQEHAHWRRNRPAQLADVFVDWEPDRVGGQNGPRVRRNPRLRSSVGRAPAL